MFNYDADLQLISSKLWHCCHLKTIPSFNLWELLAMCILWEEKKKKANPKSLVFRDKQLNNVKTSNPFIVFLKHKIVLGLEECE